MKYTFVILILFLSSCSQKPKSYAKHFDDMFEVSYMGDSTESITDVRNKVSLLAAYAAQSRGCSAFKNESTGGASQSMDAKPGMLGVKWEVANIYRCVDENDPYVPYKVKDIIKVQESRYGSLRHLIE